MLTIICDTPGKLSAIEREKPTRGDGEVLLRLRRIGICGTDLHIFSGNQPYLSYPRVMGHELAATVEEAPAGSPLRPGDMVSVHSLYFLRPVRRVPQGQGQLLPQSRRPRRAPRRRDDRLYLPAGTVRAQGRGPDARPGGYGGVPRDRRPCRCPRRHQSRRQGADRRSRSDRRCGRHLREKRGGPRSRCSTAGQTGWTSPAPISASRRRSELGTGDADELAAITNGDFFDAVFDATGNPKAIERGFAFVAHGGVYVLVSIVASDISFSDPEFHKRETSLLGSRNATRGGLRAGDGDDARRRRYPKPSSPTVCASTKCPGNSPRSPTPPPAWSRRWSRWGEEGGRRCSAWE